MVEQKLKPGWKTWRFDQMAVNVNDRIDNPSDADVEHYVGLEHLDPESLKIRRWGSPSDVEATKLLFRKGDIIFGRRRAYQRKLAVADFDGICSAHAMVLRAKPEVVLPEFLPFFMQSDLFMDRAVEISVGSLSPTINWKTLATQEFALPPLDEQRRIVDVLSKAEELIESYWQLAYQITLTANSLVEQMLSTVTTSETFALAEKADVRYGLTVNKSRAITLDTVPYLRVANVQRGELDLSEIKEIGYFDGDEAYLLENKDVLIVEGHADSKEIGRAALWNCQIERCAHQNHLIRVRCMPGLDPEFLVIYLNSTHGQRYFLKHAKSTSGLNTINSTVVREVPIPDVSHDFQVKLVEQVRQMVSDSHAVNIRYTSSKSIKNCILADLDLEESNVTI